MTAAVTATVGVTVTAGVIVTVTAVTATGAEVIGTALAAIAIGLVRRTGTAVMAAPEAGRRQRWRGLLGGADCPLFVT